MNKMRIIYFGDEDDEAYGNIKSFKNIEDFKNEIEKQLGYKVQLSNIRAEKCIMTSEGISCDLLIPLSTTDIDIDAYYIADIEELESDSNNIQAKIDINELLDQIVKLLLGDNANLNKICKIADKYDIDFGNEYK